MKPFSRRDFVRTAPFAPPAAMLATSARPKEAGPSAQVMPRASVEGAAPIRWLDGSAPAAFPGATWGVSWPRGEHAAGTEFTLTTPDGTAVPVQSWPIATWPDGSLKWTAHAAPADLSSAASYEIAAGTPTAPTNPLTVRETASEVVVDTGAIEATVAKAGEVLIPSLTRGDDVIARNGRLVCLLEDRSTEGVRREVPFAGRMESVELESSGPVRAVVKIEGRHADADRAWLPFVVRLYFYAGGDAVRVMHTIVFDGDQNQDFIAGLGLRCEVPLRGELHDRHVRFSGQDDGLFGEAVRGLTGLRRNPGNSVQDAQVAGEPTSALSEWSEAVTLRLQCVPAHDEWTLAQPNADGFQIRKRTRAGYTWLTAAQGQRAGGLGYVGTPLGGLGFGIRGFWQSHPSQLDVRGATTDEATVTLWLWSPEAPAMDLRSYHDGMGQDTYAEQYNGGLEITYEDYEPGFDTPMGVARTSEMQLWVLAATPSRDRLADIAAALREPPVLTTTPEHLHSCAVFGGSDVWTPVDRSDPARAAIEDKLDWYVDYYRDQQDQRRWYGYWNYGDVMHTYDLDRHEWRYDVGGYAWDNSELATDIWLWLQFVRSGRADVFRFAEAMCRHTGEVDVHHLGRFAPLGSRHNVLHWGCSAKQLRISTAINRRYYYHLTADERVGDLMREQLEAARTLLDVPPTRKLASAETAGDLARAESVDRENVGIGFGTDWGSLAGAWLTEWERTGNELYRGRLLAGMRTIGAQPHGFFSAGVTMNLDTGAFSIAPEDATGLSHLNAVFGLVEICAELNQVLDIPEFREAWLDYCELYSAEEDVQEARIGRSFGNNSLRQGHSRLTAYSAVKRDRPDLAARAWDEFGGNNSSGLLPLERRTVEGPAALREVEEATGVSTNDAAQWGLAAIQNLALVGDSAPSV